MTVEFSLAKANLQKLIQEFSPLGALSNEAQTRFSFIDKLLEECLGWPRLEIKVEVYEDQGRTDYECGQPRALIVEAKKSKVTFKFPPKKGRQKILLSSLMEFDDEVKAAIVQVQEYGSKRGVGPVAVSNGPQLIVFLATNLDGKTPLKGSALVFDGYEELLGSFSVLYEVLSKEGVLEKRMQTLLGDGIPTTLPQKISANCLNYFSHKHSSEFQESLKNAASIVIEDLGRTTELERHFLESCYCESGPLTQYSLVGKNLVAARYAALFPAGEVGSRVQPINPKRGNSKAEPFTEQVLQEALARRPVVLVGDVGVGKTTFLKHLMLVSGKDVFSKAISIYFDLGTKGALSTTTKDAFLDQIESTLRDDLGINLSSKLLIEELYKRELKDYDEGFNSDLKELDPARFLAERIALIRKLSDKRETHLRLVLEHTVRAKKCQSVIIIDNADQRNFAVQQEAFLIAQELADSWNSLVFLALRPQTFHASKRTGALSAYPTKIFVIPPPKLEDAIQKRLEFSLKMAEGQIPLKNYGGVTLHIDSLAKLITSLLRSLVKNRELYEFIVNVSGGNVRLAVELVSKYLGSPNVESEKIVKIIAEQGSYDVSLHEFTKAALLSEYSHFQEESSSATNVFSLIYRDKREHFLSLMILGYLSWDGAQTLQTDGFVSLKTLIDEMQANGFAPEQTTSNLQKLVRRKLLETTERRLLETGDDVKERGLPEAFRVTTVGAYHLKKWVSEFSHLESMAFDTNILDDEIRNRLLVDVNDIRLQARYRRASDFREYLDQVWKDSFTPKPYFDWISTRQLSSNSFSRVERKLRDQSVRVN